MCVCVCVCARALKTARGTVEILSRLYIYCALYCPCCFVRTGQVANSFKHEWSSGRCHTVTQRTVKGDRLGLKASRVVREHQKAEECGNYRLAKS